MATSSHFRIGYSSLFLLGILLWFPPPSNSANILVFNAVGTHSTRMSMWPYLEALAERGHNVTLLAAFRNPTPHPKVHEFYPPILTAGMRPWEEEMKFFDLRKNSGSLQMWYGLWRVAASMCETVLADPEFQSWLKNSNFDLIILEAVFNECGLGLVHHFKSKMILYSTTTMFPCYIDALGFPDETASVSDLLLGYPSGREMSFLQRVVNAWHPVVYNLIRENLYFPQLEGIAKKYLELEHVPSFRDIERFNTTIVFLTNHISLDSPRSFPPNVIPIGGVVSSGKVKPMSKELQEFIQGAKEGFIYISFGTVADFVNFDEEVQAEFIRALWKFPKMKFVWKLDRMPKEKLPDNVLVVKWAPQQTLLAHDKIKAFITHSGMGSTTESINFGVPLICLPVLMEQDYNANLIGSRGAGIVLEILTLKQKELEDAISEILLNKKYSEKMKKLSELFKDRQVAPLDNAVWWTEYVLRHDNINEYMISPSTQHVWWRKRQLDVWFFSMFTIFTVILFALSLIYVVIRKCLFSGQVQRKKKQS